MKGRGGGGSGGDSGGLSAGDVCTRAHTQGRGSSKCAVAFQKQTQPVGFKGQRGD